MKALGMFICISIIVIASGCFDQIDDYDEVIHDELNKTPIKIYIGTDINNHRVGGRVYRFSNLLEDFLEENLPDYEFYLAFEQTVPGNLLSREILFEEEWGEHDDIEPDIIIDYPHQIPFLLEVDHLEFDMIHFSEMYDIDLNQFDNRFLEQIMAVGDGTLYALPLIRSLHALKYNVYSFDEYGLDYPTDETTWLEVAEWKMEIPQWEYFYINMDLKLLLNQLSTTFSEALSIENKEMWLEIVDIIQPFTPYQASLHNRGSWASYGDIVKIHSTNSNDYFLERMEWDLAPFPAYPGKYRQGPDYVTDIIAVTPYTTNIEGAFEVVNLLVSEKFQLELSKYGHGSPLRNEHVHQNFGAYTPYYEGKDTTQFFRNNPSSTGYSNDQERLAEEIVISHMLEIIFYLEIGDEIGLEMNVEEQIEEMIREYVEAVQP